MYIIQCLIMCIVHRTMYIVHVKIDIEVGIFFFRHHDVLLCADHEFLKNR